MHSPRHYILSWSSTPPSPLHGACINPQVGYHRFSPFGCAITDPRVGLLGAMQSLFEGSMYTFVFLWTPALSPDGEHLPHGMIFACFMVSSMAGSALAGRLLAHGSG